MRVAVDAYHALRPHGGIARYIRGLVSEMAQQAPGDRFILFTNRFREMGEVWQPRAGNVETVALKAPRRLMQMAWGYLGMPSVERWLGEIDLFHGTHFVLPAMRSAKCVLTVHDLTYLRHPEYFSDRMLNERGYRHELPRALKRADAVIAVSHATKHDLVELMAFPEERVEVIYEGVGSHFFRQNASPEPEKVLARYGLHPPYLIFLVGTPEPRKNLARTVRAAQRAAPDMPLAIIGPQEPIRSLLGNAPRQVHLLGLVPDDDLPCLLRCAEISLYPSLYEGFGLPLVESMAAGVPVITSNISACPEVVGDAGVCVDPNREDAIAEAIAALLANPDARKRYREKGKERAALFTWRSAAEQTLQLYRSLL